MNKYFFIIPIALVVLYLVIVFFISYWNLNKIVSAHIPSSDDTPEKHGLEYETVSFKTEDNLKLSGWILTSPNPKGLVVLLHGVGVDKGGSGKPSGGKAAELSQAEFLVKGGFNVFSFDRRNQGDSEDKKMTFGKDEVKDIAAAEKYIDSRADLRSLPRGMMGISLGGSIAYLAAPNSKNLKALVSVSSYSDLAKQFEAERDASPFKSVPLIGPISSFTFEMILGTKLSNLSPKNFVGKITVPVLITHGEKDSRISVEQARILYSAAKEPKTLWLTPDGEHGILNDETPLTQQADYKQKVIEFLSSNLKN